MYTFVTVCYYVFAVIFVFCVARKCKKDDNAKHNAN